MSETIKQFLTRNAKVPGLMALAVQYPDKSVNTQKCSRDFPGEVLENAWRSLMEAIPVLKLNQLPSARFRWVYTEAIVHCEYRKDGSCLGIFGARGNNELNDLEIDRLVAEFHAVP